MSRASYLRLLVCIFLFPLTPTLFFAQSRGGGGGHGTTTTTTTNHATPTQTLTGVTPVQFPGAIPINSADEEAKIEFRTQSVLVQVPVVVLDKSGNHIHGLTKDDFHIFENGKEQKLSSFEEIVATTDKFPPPDLKPGEFGNLTLSEDHPRTVTVIAIDTVNTPFLDQYTGRRELVKYLASNLESGQVLALMIITGHGLKIVQGLTGDPEQLMKVLKKVSGENPALVGVSTDAQAAAAADDFSQPAVIAPGSDPTAAIESFMSRGNDLYAQFQQQNAVETTMNAFLGIAWSLSGVPGRKSLIWATGGFPFWLSSASSIPGGPGTYLSALYERTMSALNSAQISIYPVDIRGLISASPIGDVSQTRVRTGAAFAQQLNDRAWLQASSLQSLSEFAEMTGGKAFYNTNDLASSFKRAADDASSYYLASYYLDMKNDHAGWRQLKVKTDKKDVEVRARKGFFVTNATIRQDMSRTTDLSYALVSPLEGTGVPVKMQFLPASGDGPKKTAQFLVQLPPNGISIQGSDGKNHLNFDFAAAAFVINSKDGKPSTTASKSITSPLSDAQLATLRASGLGFKNSLELGPGQYSVRVVIRDNVTGKVGSVTAPLTVN